MSLLFYLHARLIFTVNSLSFSAQAIRDNCKGGKSEGVLSGNSANEPLHVGEITGIWAHLLSTNGLLRLYETFINHAGDTELKREIQDLMRTMQDETKQLSKLLKENGVALPPTTPKRPLANAEDIPVGGRLLDPEIASTVGMNLEQGMVSCSMVMGQCLREDVALIVWSV